MSTVVTNTFCGLSVIFCGFISHLIGRKTINIPEIFSGVHGFTGKTGNTARFLGPVGDWINGVPLYLKSGLSLVLK